MVMTELNSLTDKTSIHPADDMSVISKQVALLTDALTAESTPTQTAAVSAALSIAVENSEVASIKLVEKVWWRNGYKTGSRYHINRRRNAK